ncbi:MAG: transcriptional repressor [bacterium]|nr:transcriptional repressor [bacterium]MDT8395551.1 transcriptional repressor [bacterium]
MSGQSRRMTRQRDMILEEVRKVRTHPTADDVYEMVRRRLPRISLGTVYRNLDRLSREGLILKIEGEGQRRYDGDTGDHLHLRCARCGCVGDLPQAARIPAEVLRAARAVGFAVTGCRVEYLGLCGECAKARSQDPGARTREEA